MSVVNTWKAFIKAQEVFINQYAEPFSISYTKTDNENFLHFDIEEKNPLNSIGRIIRKAFPGVHDEEINLRAGYLHYDSSLSPQISEELMAEAEANYLELDKKPCFSGTIKEKSNAFLWLRDEIGINKIRSGECFATFSQIEEIDSAIKAKPEFSRLPAIGGIFRVKPSKYYINKQYELISKYLRDVVGISDIEKHGYNANVVLKNVFLNEVPLNFITENTGYQKSHHRIIFTIREEVFSSFLNSRKGRGIYFTSEDLNNDKTGIILPDPINNTFHFTCNGSISLSELRYEISHFKRVFERYFGNENCSIEHQHIFQIDHTAFYQYVQAILDPEQFAFSSEKETIGFDFSRRTELDKQLQYLESLKIIDLDYKGDDHGFKIRLEYDSPLTHVEAKLHEIPSLNTKFSNDNQVLSFFCSFDDITIVNQLRARITDSINSFENTDLSFSFDELNKGKLKYYINFREDGYEFEITNKFNSLVGEEISIPNGRKQIPFGTITKLNYPKLIVQLASPIPDGLDSGESIEVCCSMKGERDKVKRLSDTLDTLFSPSSTKIPNSKLKEILIESSKAESFPGDILLTQEYKETLREVESSLLSSFINDRQKEAITKCLLASDFFVIQGPPGTGKSTAIAELIWQHIRAHHAQRESIFKVLVTSETNLAVDNALDKLRSKHHLLIKPVRFGSEEKLDKEGRKFSLEAIKQWKTIGNTDSDYEIGDANIVQDWISLVASRSSKRISESSPEWANRWQSYLNKPDSTIKEIFADTYLKNANVIGATCSSIGKLNSQNRFTRFFTDYAAIRHPKELESFNSLKSQNTIANLKSKEIEFDLVVQDEASKASPPELALPCLFGRKAVVIGDHRQLPPTVDTNEFIDNLSITARKSKVEKNRNEIFNLVQFIKQNREEFSISHFEKLFKAINTNLKSSFNIQYRMHPAINETIKQFYIEDGGLECGIPYDIADSNDLSHPLNRFHGVTANKNTHVIWLNTTSPEIKNGTSRINHGEVDAIDWLLSYFKKSPGYERFLSNWSEKQLEEKQIGIITFYGAQANLLSKLKLKYPEIPLRVSPVDRFQGMERNIVIVSLVRSNSIANYPNQLPDFNNPLFNEYGYPAQESLGFAEFPNRLNVALSRAKRLLIIVGNSQHFGKHPIYKRVFDTIKNSPYGSVKDFKSINAIG